VRSRTPAPRGTARTTEVATTPARPRPAVPDDASQEEARADGRLVDLAGAGPGRPGTEGDLPDAETRAPVEQNTFEADGAGEPARKINRARGTRCHFPLFSGAEAEAETEAGAEAREPAPSAVERPAGLQRELLAALRRKITQHRSAGPAVATPPSAAPTPTPTPFPFPPPTPVSDRPPPDDAGTLPSDDDVSPGRRRLLFAVDKVDGLKVTDPFCSALQRPT